jgi:2-polyprenyl-3-methyl-5-hydroxy-6-metoxy-1,4-benzoquinol methylase
LNIVWAMHHYRLHHDSLSSHQQIAKLVRDLGRKPILDVGCAQGMLGQLIQGSGLDIDGVEPNSEWAAAARAYYRRVEHGTVESVNLPENHYQVVVCADVLEHVVDPVAALNRLRRHATQDATFIISLPNIAHISVRLLLLFGYFPKMNRGLLDRTHLHFFTRDTAIQMIARAGLKAQRYSATVAPLVEVWPSGEGSLPYRILWHIQRTALRLSPALFAYQWVIVAQPNPDSKP